MKSSGISICELLDECWRSLAWPSGKATDETHDRTSLEKDAALQRANTSEGCAAASCDDETGVPTGRSTSGWRLEQVGVHASTRKQPRDQ